MLLQYIRVYFLTIYNLYEAKIYTDIDICRYISLPFFRVMINERSFDLGRNS